MTISVRNHWNSGRTYSALSYLNMQRRLRSRRTEAILFTEHAPAVTAGIQAQPQNLLCTEEDLHREGIAYIRTERGGDHTAHEPGQLTVYVHLDLKKRNLKVGQLVRSVTDAAAFAVNKAWGIQTSYNREHPGLYGGPGSKKLAAIGLMIRNDFSSFGFSVNIHNSLKTFDYIIPCGTPVASPVTVSQVLSRESGDARNIKEIRNSVSDFAEAWLGEFRMQTGI